MSELTFYPSRWKLIRGVFAGILLTALFVAILLFHTQWHVDTQWWLVAYPGVPVAALATLYWLVRIFQHRPALRVTSAGIIDTSSAVGVGLIHWEEIATVGMKITKTNSSKNTYLTITVRDRQALIARQASPLTKLYDSVGDTIDIGQVMLPIKVPQLLAQIEAFYQGKVAATSAQPVFFNHVVDGK